MDDKKLFDALAIAHCIAQSEMYESALQKYENGYTTKTNIWEMLTMAETEGVQPVASIVASILTGAKFGALNDPVTALRELVLALKYKTKFFNPKECKDNNAVKILNEVYNTSLDVVHNCISNGDLPSDIAEQVGEFIYDYD